MYNHTAKITLNNGVKGEVTTPMPTNPTEWADVVLGDGDVALSRINELTVRSFVIARASGARKERTMARCESYMSGYVFGEKGSPQPTTVDKELEWTPAMLAHFKEVGIEVA
jgi:hypothetical protein